MTNFGEIIRKDLQEEANERRVKISVVLTGEAARAFQALHQTINQGQEISAGQLAARLLGLSLSDQEEPRRRRTRSAEIHAHTAQESL